MGWKNVIFLAALTFAATYAGQESRAQDAGYAHQIVNELASPKYWGRGYLSGGMERAAKFIADELAHAGIRPLSGSSYFQDFEYSINTFPNRIQVTINGKPLQPGRDFLVTAASSGRVGSFAVRDAKDPKQPGLYVDDSKQLLVRIVDKLTWAARQKDRVVATTEIQVLRSRFAQVPLTLSLTVQPVVVEHFHAQNIAAIVPGTKSPQQYLVISAHYDHLGGIADQAYFPGANDNASGVAFVLDLARHYQAHPQAKSIVFLFFGGEEAGLVGSKYFVEHPLLDLKAIRFLTNFDMVGTGDDGATAVNALLFPTEFKSLQDANAELGALPQLGARGEAANSDHYWFSKAGVPSFFLYTQGGIAAYHDVDDRPETLPFTRYSTLFKLIVRFQEKLMN